MSEYYSEYSVYCLPFFINFKVYISPHFSISEIEMFCNQWQLNIIVGCEIVATVCIYVNSRINPACMTGQLQSIDVLVDMSFKDHLRKRLPLLFLAVF